MNEDLLRALSRDLSADTPDCPSLVHRVAAGVARRRRRHRAVAGAMTIAIVAVVGPAVALDHEGANRTTSGVGALCGSATSDCGRVLSARADLALRRANSRDFTGQLILSIAPADSCLNRAYCRGPV